jgi:hypothetical protein
MQWHQTHTRATEERCHLNAVEETQQIGTIEAG